jgi:hypothetical protein
VDDTVDAAAANVAAAEGPPATGWPVASGLAVIAGEADGEAEAAAVAAAADVRSFAMEMGRCERKTGAECVAKKQSTHSADRHRPQRTCADHTHREG